MGDGVNFSSLRFGRAPRRPGLGVVRLRHANVGHQERGGGSRIGGRRGRGGSRRRRRSSRPRWWASRTASRAPPSTSSSRCRRAPTPRRSRRNRRRRGRPRAGACRRGVPGGDERGRALDLRAPHASGVEAPLRRDAGLRPRRRRARPRAGICCGGASPRIEVRGRAFVDSGRAERVSPMILFYVTQSSRRRPCSNDPPREAFDVTG